MIDLVISYAHEDDGFRKEIEKFLVILKRQKVINIWTDRRIYPGSNWNTEISNHFQESIIILLLVSQDFLNSDYCYEIELTWALEKHLNNEAVVIPIILRPCDWESTPLKDLQALPTDAQPISQWDDRDLAYLDVTLGLRTVINKMTNREQISEPLYIPGPAKASNNGEVPQDSPYIKYDHTYMPIRYLAGKFGILEENVIWDEAEGILTMVKDDILVQIKVGSTELIINDISITMDVPTEVINGRVMAPLVYIAQAFGAKAFYNDRNIMIESWR